MNTDHDVASYLLHALEPDELQEFEAHLPHCQACQLEIVRLSPSRNALAMAVPQYEASPELKEKVMAIVKHEADVLASAQAPMVSSSQSPAKRSWSWSWPRLSPSMGFAALAACLVLIMVGTWPRENTTSFHAQVEDPRARAVVVVNNGQAQLRLRNFPQAPKGKVYQVWVHEEGKAPLATDVLFDVRSNGTSTVTVEAIEGAGELLVTAEEAGGSDVPTSQPILRAPLRS